MGEMMNFVIQNTFIMSVVAVLIFIVAIFIRMLFPNKKNNLPEYMPNRHGNLVEETAEYELIHKMVKIDKNFDKETFVTYAKKIFINLEKAWTDKNFNMLKMYEDEALFEKHSQKIQYFIDHKQVNVIDMIVVRNVNLYSVEEAENKDILSVLLTCSLIDYVKEEKSNKVISGNQEERVNRTYLMSFTRPKGILSHNQVDTNWTIVQCPNCGEKAKLSSMSECKACGVFLRVDKNDWILNKIEPYENT